MRKLLASISLVGLLAGCGTPVDKTVILNAIAEAGAKCNGDTGCLITLNAAIAYGGLLQNEDSTVRLMGASIPILNIGLELTRIIMGGYGLGGQGLVLNKSNNNKFIMPRYSADRSSPMSTSFVLEKDKTQSWSNMYNVPAE